jgi:hypothetical protein
VWNALRDHAQLRRWFGWDAEGLADEIEDIFVTHAVPSEDERTLGFDDISDRFELEERGPEETVLRLLGEPVGDDYDGMLEGWLTFVAQLRFAIERHPGKERRTLYLTGSAATAPQRTVMSALGVPDLATRAAVGDRYEVRDAGGEVSISGEVWARSERQTAITVGDGTGLLVATELPPDERPPHGGATALITSFGLQDDDFQRVRQSWTGWWQARYSSVTATVWPE